MAQPLWRSDLKFCSIVTETSANHIIDASCVQETAHEDGSLGTTSIVYIMAFRCVVAVALIDWIEKCRGPSTVRNLVTNNAVR